MSQIESGVELLRKHLHNDLTGLELSQEQINQLLLELDTSVDIIIDSYYGLKAMHEKSSTLPKGQH